MAGPAEFTAEPDAAAAAAQQRSQQRRQQRRQQERVVPSPPVMREVCSHGRVDRRPDLPTPQERNHERRVHPECVPQLRLVHLDRVVRGVVAGGVCEEPDEMVGEGMIGQHFRRLGDAKGRGPKEADARVALVCLKLPRRALRLCCAIVNLPVDENQRAVRLADGRLPREYHFHEMAFEGAIVCEAGAGGHDGDGGVRLLAEVAKLLEVEAAIDERALVRWLVRMEDRPDQRARVVKASLVVQPAVDPRVVEERRYRASEIHGTYRDREWVVRLLHRERSTRRLLG
eukprot:7391498-Prymnesium_polylepis.2